MQYFFFFYNYITNLLVSLGLQNYGFFLEKSSWVFKCQNILKPSYDHSVNNTIVEELPIAIEYQTMPLQTYNTSFLLVSNYFFLILSIFFLILILLFSIFFGNKIASFNYLKKNLFILNKYKKYQGCLDLSKHFIYLSILFISFLLFFLFFDIFLYLQNFKNLSFIFLELSSIFWFLFLAVFFILLLFFFFYSLNFIKKKKILNNVSFYINGDLFIIIWFSVISFFFLLYSLNLFTIYLGFELLSLSFYILIASRIKSLLSIESSIKYLILSVFSSSLFLLGISLFYFIFGTIDLHLIYYLSFYLKYNFEFLFFYCGVCLLLIGLIFKLGIAPFHTWVPDVYESTNLIFVVFIGFLPKLIYLTVLWKLFFFCNILNFYNITYLFVFFGVLSLFIGTIGALNQYKLRRFLAYSSITHMSFLLFSMLSLSLNSLISLSFFYLLNYIIISLIIFSIINIIFNKEITLIYNLKFNVLNKNMRLLLVFWIFSFFSLGGIPPFSGFFIKYLVLKNLLFNSYYFLSFFILLFSSISIYYYLRFIISSFFLPTINVKKNTKNIWYFINFNNDSFLYFFCYLNYINFFMLFFYQDILFFLENYTFFFFENSIKIFYSL